LYPLLPLLSPDDELSATPSITDPSDELRLTAPDDGNEEDVDVGVNVSARVGDVVDGCSVEVDIDVGTGVGVDRNEEGTEEGVADGFEDGGEEGILEGAEEGAADGFEDGTVDEAVVRDNDGSLEQSLVESSTFGSSHTVFWIQSKWYWTDV
jgi:hypothetical protein